MANIIRIKRRATGGAAGAPASLANAELAFNEQDDVLYYGKGTGGAGGTATTVEAIGGRGAFVGLAGDQSITGAKTFSGEVNVPTPTAISHAVNKAYADSLVPNVLPGSGITVATGDGSVTIAADSTLARVASPTFTGTPAAPTASAGTNTTQIATTAFVQAAVTAGSVASAAKLTTARTISASGDASWSVSFDGSANATAALTLANSGVSAGTYPKVTVDSKGRVTAGTALATSDIPPLDAAKITTGTLTVGTSGNAATATKLATAWTVSATGDATWSVSFDGSANASAALTLANSGVTAGTHTKVTVDAKGRVTAGAGLAAADIPTIDHNKISDFDTAVQTSRLDQMAAPTAAVSMNSQRLTGLADPTSTQDAATKNYVDMAVQGLDPKQSVRAASTGNIATLSGTMTIDGVALVAGDRVLVKDQTTASQNGVYEVSASAWARAADMDAWEELVSAYLFVEQGTVNADMGFLCTVDGGGTLGTTAVSFVQFNGAGQIIAGNGLNKNGNELSVGAGTGISVGATTVGLTGQALALHNLGTNGLFARTGSDTVAARSVAASGSGVSVSNGDGVAGNPTVSLSAALASVGGLTPAADRLPYYTGASTAALATFTAFGRSLVDDADAATARTTLGLGSLATQAVNNVAITGGSISGLTTFDGVTIDGGTF